MMLTAKISWAVIFLFCIHCVILADDAKPVDTGRLVQEFIRETDMGVCSSKMPQWDNLSWTDRIALIDEFAKHLSSSRKLVVTSSANRAVTSRVNSGEMRFSSSGQMTDQDFYIEGGRAAWAIEYLIGGSVTGIIEKMSDAERNDAVILMKSLISIYKKGASDRQQNKVIAPVPKEAAGM